MDKPVRKECRPGRVRIGNRCIIKPTKVKFVHKTGTAAFDYLEEFGETGHIEEMSPDDYLAKVGWQQLPRMIVSNCEHSGYSSWQCRELMKISTTEEVIAWQESMLNPKKIDKIALDIAKRKQLDRIPYIHKHQNMQEGRHRMAALKKLGVEKVPVLVVETKKDG